MPLEHVNKEYDEVQKGAVLVPGASTTVSDFWKAYGNSRCICGLVQKVQSCMQNPGAAVWPLGRKMLLRGLHLFKTSVIALT
jgi:hypothetical protein